MSLFVYVVNSNLWIEGLRLSAVCRGMAGSIHEAMERGTVDHSWGYDFGKLYDAMFPDGERIGRSSLFGSKPPANDSLWGFARDRGFEVFTFDRNSANKEKQVDVAIATKIREDSFEAMAPGGRAVLISGDRDYLPTIQSLHRRGFPTTVAFWEHATAAELKRPPVDFFPLDGLFNYLSRA